MAEVTMSVEFQDHTVKLNKDSLKIYNNIKKKYEEVCKYLIEYDQDQNTLKIPEILSLSSRAQDKESECWLAFFDNGETGWTIRNDRNIVLPKNFCTSSDLFGHFGVI